MPPCSMSVASSGMSPPDFGVSLLMSTGFFHGAIQPAIEPSRPSRHVIGFVRNGVITNLSQDLRFPGARHAPKRRRFVRARRMPCGMRRARCVSA
ncbi:hypothetical protein WS70_02965 [Burkholderia mayonis]|uniref:Uncharacterized protein n=1 Tax=Burkholderia mayonis TaxID=1385591 RepID=A0A1B4FB35_9BURK|nr:hypothetical protein WS70_02965 [Burkholderia mayonis]KVE49763.1 hypothetical protein WS70_18400 [Burkholderia mayonis]